MAYSMYNNNTKRRVDPIIDDTLIQDKIDSHMNASIKHLDTTIKHDNKDAYIDKLLEMFGKQFKINKNDLSTIVDVYRVVDYGLTREILLKIVKELKIIDTYKTQNENKQNKSTITTQYSPNMDGDTQHTDITTSTPISQLINTNNNNTTAIDDLLSSLKETTTEDPFMISAPTTINTQPPSQKQYQPPQIINSTTKQYHNISIPQADIPKSQVSSSIIIKSNIIDTPNTYILNYPVLKQIDLDTFRSVNYGGVYISASICQRYNLHEMPYLLLIINKKYKIPFTLTKQNSQFYIHNKYKGPIRVTNIDIEILDFMNNPLNIHLMPTEIFHILFETTT